MILNGYSLSSVCLPETMTYGIPRQYISLERILLRSDVLIFLRKKGKGSLWGYEKKVLVLHVKFEEKEPG